jgi:hypothetical protein
MATDRLKLTDVARKFAPSSGLKVSLATVRRWTKKGVISPLTGKRVVLETERIGGRFYTRVEWLEEFFTLCSGKRRCDARRVSNHQHGRQHW